MGTPYEAPLTTLLHNTFFIYLSYVRQDAPQHLLF